MGNIVRARLDIDKSASDAKMQQIKQEYAATARAIANNLRRVASMAIIIASASNQVVSQVLQIQIEALLLAIDTAVATQAAAAAGSFGIAAIRLTLGGGSVAFLMITIQRIRRGQLESARVTNQISLAMRVYSNA